MDMKKIDDLAARITDWLGSVAAILGSFGLVALWAAAGPFLKFSSGWQLAINTGTTIITFLMVFIILHTEKRDSRAMQAKLDAIIKALEGAEDRLIGLEERSEAEIKAEQAELRDGPS